MAGEAAPVQGRWGRIAFQTNILALNAAAEAVRDQSRALVDAVGRFRLS